MILHGIDLEREVGPLAISLAIKPWQSELNIHKEIDFELGAEFAKILDDILSKPWLGNATTKELINEIEARGINIKVLSLDNIDLNYKTVDEPIQPKDLSTSNHLLL